jgi:hypothetical protein
MRMRKLLIAGMTSVMLLVTASAAMAGQVNGSGKSHLGNTIGYNAKSDLKGSFEYNGDPNGAQADINAHCDDYDSYSDKTYTDHKQNPGVYPMVRISTTTCVDQLNGETYKLVANLVDEGEPGTFDFHCIRIFDLETNVMLVHDRGYLQNGNIQIHLDTDATELVPTE